MASNINIFSTTEASSGFSSLLINKLPTNVNSLFELSLDYYHQESEEEIEETELILLNKSN
jgi:hypothetical protein